MKWSFYILVLGLGVFQTACSGGLEPGEGPGFSIFDPEITGEELLEAVPLSGFNSGEVDALSEGESLKVDCERGGTKTITLIEFMWLNDTENSGRASLQYSACADTMEIRGENYDVTLNGTMNSEWQESGGEFNAMVQIEISVSGGLGFSIDCTSNDFDWSCVFLDNDGVEITHEGVIF